MHEETGPIGKKMPGSQLRVFLVFIRDARVSGRSAGWGFSWVAAGVKSVKLDPENCKAAAALAMSMTE